MVELILGGARSGKSRQAEARAAELESQGKQVIYVATARSTAPDGEHDQEMSARIERHRKDRPQHWQTVESPLKLADTLQAHDRSDVCILVDCLTLWTLNLIESDDLEDQRDRLLDTLPALSADLILVGNEVGLGVVPMGELTRRFVDELGWLHQRVAERAHRVTFMAAGLPMVMKAPDGKEKTTS